MGIRHTLLLIAVILGLFGPAVPAAVNSICRDGAVPWRCKAIETCNTLEKEDTIQVCGFNGKPLVCCPPASSNFIPRQREPTNSRNGTRN